MNLLNKYYWLILPFLAWVIVRFVFDFNGLYGQDAYAYLLHTKEWQGFMLGGDVPGAFFWPPNYSIVAALLSFMVPSEFYALQLVSVLAFAGVGGLLDYWIRNNFQTTQFQRIGYVVIAWFLSPYLFRLGMQSMSDMLAMLFLTASFVQLWEFEKTNSLKSLLFWSAASSLAITTRYPAIVLVLPVILYVAFFLILRKEFSKLILGTTVGVLPILIAIIWKVISGGVDGAITAVLLEDWSLNNFWTRTFIRPDSVSTYTLPNVLFNISVFIHPGMLVFGLVLIPFTRLKNVHRAFLITLLSIAVYIAFLSGIPFQNSRVLSFCFPLVVIFFYKSFVALLDWMSVSNISQKIAVAMLVCFQVALCTRAMSPSIKYNRLEREIVEWVRLNAKSNTIYTSDFVQLFDAHQTGNKTVNIFQEQLENFDNDGLFLYNETVASYKLKETTISENWGLANRRMTVEKQHCWTDGWCIYSLHSK